MDNEAYNMDPPVVSQPAPGTNGQSKGDLELEIWDSFIAFIEW